MRFALIGAAGYIAPRHMKAIHDVGGELVACVDPHDSVGILDRYFPGASFFTEFERFDRHLDKLCRSGQGVDFVSICSPNYLHDAHIRMALRSGADAICEKPVVIKPHNLAPLQELEAETNHRVNVVLQLRLHPVIQELKSQVSTSRHQVKLIYHTPRGKWYHQSWKALPEKSGGLPMNIGVHFYDALQWIFGAVKTVRETTATADRITGELELERADVSYDLSIQEGSRKRILTVDGQYLDFTNGFEELHTAVYREIVAGRGFSLEDARASIELSNLIRGS